MLTHEEVKPLLLHEDWRVRNLAGHYFWNRPDDPELLPLVLEATRRYGAEENWQCVGLVPWLRTTPESLRDVLDLAAESTDEYAKSRLEYAVLRAPVDLVAPLEREIAEVFVAGDGGDVLERLHRRRALAALDDERLWNDLQAFARQANDDGIHDEELDRPYVDDLVDALTGRTVPSAETIRERLAAYADEEGDWLEMFLVELAGARRLREAIPELVRRLHFDDEELSEQCVAGLGRIGDPAVVRLIRDEWPQADWGFKSYAGIVLGAIPHADSEDALLALLETEWDQDIRTMLCSELCNLFSARGVEVVRREIDHGYDGEVTSLEDKLLVVAEVLGIEIPEAARWLAQREEREREAAEEYRRLLAELERAQEEERRLHDEQRRLKALHDAVPEAWEPVPVATIRNDEPKVGRNAPCPCGSGKKHKKCCGR